MKLYGRLLAMADMVEPGESIADIGTDHGLLPIFLLENKISPKAVLIDINEGPLARAKDNFDLYLPAVAEALPESRLEASGKAGAGTEPCAEAEAEFRIGNGLAPLEKGEVDTVIIAGMGGELIGEILAADPEKTKSFKKFILQPRTKMVDLRRFLHNYAFEIREERLVKEGKFICEIIVVLPPKDSPTGRSFPKKPYGKMELEVSPLLFSSADPLLEDFIRGKMKKEEYIIKEISKKGSQNSFSGLEKAKERLKELKRILNEYGGGNGD